MKRIILFLLVTCLLPISSGSTEFEDKNDVYPNIPGFYHLYHIITGEIVTKTKYTAVVIDGNKKTIQVYDCPAGTHYSCKIQACVPIGDPQECTCIASDSK